MSAKKPNKKTSTSSTPAEGPSRSEAILLRLSPTEHEQVRQRAAKLAMPPAIFVRMLALRGVMPVEG